MGAPEARAATSPPLYVAISTSPSTVEWAASQRIQPILGGPTDIMGQAPQVLKMWRDKMEEFGHPHAHLTPPMAKGIYVTPTMEEALHDPIGLDDFSSRILRSTGTTGATIGMPTDKDGKLPPGYEAWASRQQDRERRDDPGHAGLPPLRGTPEVIIERLKQTQDAGIERIFGAFGFPGLPQWKVLRSIELFCTPRCCRTFVRWKRLRSAQGRARSGSFGQAAVRTNVLAAGVRCGLSLPPWWLPCIMGRRRCQPSTTARPEACAPGGRAFWEAMQPFSSAGCTSTTLIERLPTSCCRHGRQLAQSSFNEVKPQPRRIRVSVNLPSTGRMGL